jgi:hypothetical protein
VGVLGFVHVVAATGKDCFWSEQFTNGDGSDALGVPGREVRVDFFIVLAIIANQDPTDSGKLGGEALEVCRFVLAPASKPAVGSWPPVGQ